MKEMIQPPAPSGNSPQTPPAASPPGGGGTGFDFDLVKQYFHIIVKRIWLVAICFVVSLSVTIVKLANEVPTYMASATMMMSQGLKLPVKTIDKDLTLIGDFINTQIRIIQSSAVMAAARERMNMPPSEISEQLERVSVYPLSDSAIIGIQVRGFSAQFVADYANAIVDAYLEFKARERMDASQSTVITLSQQANRLREELAKVDQQLVTFKRENEIIALEEEGNIAAKTIANLEAQSASIRTERFLLESQQPRLADASDDVVLRSLASPLASFASMNRLSASPSTTTSTGDSDVTLVVEQPRGPESLIEQGVIEQQGWERLKRKEAQIQSDLEYARRYYNEDHPKIVELKKAYEENQRSIRLEVDFALGRFYSQLESLRIQEESLKRAQEEWRDEAIAIASLSEEYDALLRQVRRLQGLYELLFNRLKEADIAMGIEPQTVAVLDRATAPGGPVSSRKLKSIFMSALIGIGIGLALAIGLEFVDSSIKYPEDVTRILKVPFLGIIPSANWDPDDLRTHLLSNIDQKSGLAESYRNIRSAYMFAPRQQEMKTLVITSAVPKEGKTTTSLNLSVSMAQAGMRVLLVDGDMRRGELHKFFGLEGGRGFADVLSGETKAESVIQRTGIPNLDLIATGPFPANPAELILRNEFHAFVNLMKRSYDKIIFDCPPIMAVSESAILASLVDSVIMVVWAGHTSRKLAELSCRVIRERGANVIGCILNNLEFGRVGYYYYSTYYGYYNYDYYYDRSSRSRGGGST